ncbi:hypothetical protein HPB48_021603 [Haemaphysalis longicornis]|uniref:Uncharacterized protein n=1 Tax=Haemaphysalis longicornis TaxID=44386 RepID=A0A9J6G921_HAELO|nr:hypothetical protein HPB48_021603 [Haemaphysalis longicornis]
MKEVSAEQTKKHSPLTLTTNGLKRAIEDVELTIFLGPKSDADARHTEEMYANIDIRPHGGYFEARLRSPSALGDNTGLVQRHLGCLDNDLGGVSFPSARRACVFPRGASPPLFYADAESFVNLPTLGFLLAAPFADVLYAALKNAPQGSEAARHFAATLQCLARQLDALTKTSLIDDQKPDLERRAFFERHCWLWCSGYVKAPQNSVAAAGAKAVCNIAVRNVLGFYLGFRCYPEDFMGSVEVCAVFGVPEQFEE